ncbi:ATP-dependent Clp protease proteolytic subunit [Bacillus velezensis]|uniref:ClpP family protease n=1 Tax=Bacillus velezensis TaxID=492670 RepID=UPI0018C519C9|nr:ATP-dependent Clp protease proteolytic subunit [Bacillus velezensis]QPK89895.1 ATP-dependent Clp protease proteolytic subunit [Bacillus velezensis]
MSEQKTENKNSAESKKRDIIFIGNINEKEVREAVEKIIEINTYDDKKSEEDENYIRKPINLYVHTSGGAVYDANFLVGIIQTSRTPVHTYAGGKIMSAGIYIYVSGHKRFATEMSTFMYHDMSVGLHNTIEGLKVNIRHYDRLRDRVDAYIIRRTNLPKRLMDNQNHIKEDLYLYAQEALRYGIVHEILPELA